MMKRFIAASIVNVVLSGFILLVGGSPALAVDVCDEGRGVPPFLAKGLPANVMLLIDNSASMYDMAYDDIEEPGFCNDDSYIAEGTINQSEWIAGPTYRAGTFAYVLQWNDTANINTREKCWYKTGTASDGSTAPMEADDTGHCLAGAGSWSSADWDTTSTYALDDIVVVRNDFPRDIGEPALLTYSWYVATAVIATGGTNPETTPGSWQRIPSMYGGYFETDSWYQWNDTDQTFQMISYVDDGQWYLWNKTSKFFDAIGGPLTSLGACSLYVTGSTHEIFLNNDLCEVIDPNGFSYNLIDFAAKGNYLNWLASSKLDVEKKILTGGKYVDPDNTADSYTDTADMDNYLQLESRGCLGRRMIKQVEVFDDANAAKVLTMAVAQGEETSGGNGTDVTTCKNLCTSANVVTCTNDCSTSCSGQCPADPACGVVCDDARTTCQTNHTSCYATCETAYDVCMDAANNDSQEDICFNKLNTSGLEPCQWVCDSTWDCDTDHAVCDAGCVAEPVCVAACESTCDTDCTDQCENDCDVAWTGADLPIEVSRIQFFPPTDAGFQFGNTDCEAAIVATQFGQVQNLAESCLGIGKQQESFTNSNAAFNHGFQTCWGYPTVGTGDITRMINACENIYQEGVDATDIESTDSGYVCMGDSSDGSGYIGRCLTGWTPNGTGTCVYTTCTGPLDPTLGLADTCRDGYAYSCPTGYIWEDSLRTCIDNTPDPTIQSPQVLQFTGDCDVTWVAAHDDNLDDSALPPRTDPEGCVEWAIRDYCGEMYNPPVPDADSPVTSVADEHFPNLPAILTDVALNAQLGDPFKIVPALIQGERQQAVSPYKEIAPEGLLQTIADNLHIGALTFNSLGTAWEVDNATTSDVLLREDFYGYQSGTAGHENRDGSVVIDYITETEDINTLVKSINQIKATSWTPMSEALYNAVGYYTRDKRLSTADFYKKADTAADWASGTEYSLGSLVKNGAGDVYWAVTKGTSAGTDLANDSAVGWELLRKASDAPSVAGHDPYVLDPVKAHCQSNNILLLTDGASTGDMNPAIDTLVGGLLANDITDGCGRFSGSTYSDNMAYYGQHETGIYANEQYDALYPYDSKKKPIQTYVVTTGALNVDGTENECRADVILEETAKQGGTERYYPGEDAAQLQEQLEYIFSSLGNRASAGSAASVISSSRGGEGAIYQAIFWPEKKVDGDVDKSHAVDWAGDVHALFIDSSGIMYEDTPPSGGGPADAQFDPSNDEAIVIYYDAIRESSMACYGTVTYPGGVATCSASSVKIEDINYLWSAAEWLSPADATENTGFSAIENRPNYISETKKRYIYTWNDLNDDGIVDYSTEWIPFEGNLTIDGSNVISWKDKNTSGTSEGTVANDRSTVLTDFDVATVAEANKIIKWIRGHDDLTDPSLRSRLTEDKAGNEITWRLGDVIHSTPMTVTSPAEGYHLLYNDFSYAQFYARWRERRHMIYFGGNDGMLHAVNGGFYNVQEKKFCRTNKVDATTGNCDETTGVPTNGYPHLGAEMWAYVPYNLVPHLGCLTQPDYTAQMENHKYYVDLRPRIFDAQIFPEEGACTDKKADACKHPNGWGTILVGGMRFGGAPIEATELQGALAADPREFISSYFVFDITDPENPPILLGETTRWKDGKDSAGDHVDLGRSSNISTMAIMKKDGVSSGGLSVPAPANAFNESNDAHNQWYLILGSGPNGPLALKGRSEQMPRVSVLPLDWLVTSSASSRRALRIPAIAPTATEAGGTWTLDGTLPSAPLPSAPLYGFTGDLITIDVDIAPSFKDYMSDAIYFGTAERNATGDNSGRMYRLMTRKKDTAANPGKWLIGRSVPPQLWSTPDQWEMTVFTNNGQPITAAPTMGFDGNNYWLYFGTGRFFDSDDKSDNKQQSFYGIKEPIQGIAYDHDGNLSTADITVQEFLGKTVDVPTVHAVPQVTWPDQSKPVGEKGLLKSDEIRVEKSPLISTATLHCRDNTTDCIPDPTNVTTLDDLIQYTAGGDKAWANSADGWYYDFYPYLNRERNVGQATLFGGLTLFTTYQPFADECMAEGTSYLYGLYYQTGTPWSEVIFGEPNGLYSNGRDVKEKFSVGPGLATTPNLHVGDDSGGVVKAFLQSSTGEIIKIEHHTATEDTSSGRTGWKMCLD